MSKMRTGVIFAAAACLATCLGLPAEAAEPNAKRPNILWITCEDMSASLGCYGDAYAKTPRVDALAKQSIRYTNCFTHAGVCAPSRSGLILGMYPTTNGSMHMRSNVPPAPGVRTYSAHLRDAGYWCTNNSKTDFNFPVPKDCWDQNGPQAHWRNRPDPKQPFFAIFNFTVTHESQSRPSPQQHQKNTARLTADQRHDPAAAPLPPYYADTPGIRRNVADHYDTVSAMDHQVGDVLEQLEKDGLADSTIVFFYSDHGRGLTRGKRWQYDSGLHVPLLVRYPDGAKAGTTNDELVAFVDLGPTALSLAGVPIPSTMQGRAFLGPQTGKTPREYVYGARDRMDERYDLIRSVRDRRFKYIRNFMPWQPYAQNIAYMNQMPILKELRALHAAGKLDPVQALFFAPTKPTEELYDCINDPHEVRNLAGDPAHKETLDRLRKAQDAWRAETHDLGAIPEPLMLSAQAADPKGWRETFRKDGRLERIWKYALPAPAGPTPEEIAAGLRDADPAVRWWCVQQAAWANRDPLDGRPATDLFLPLLKDPEVAVRWSAADALCRLGAPDPALPVLVEQLGGPDDATALAAALTLDELGVRARPALEALKAAAAKKRPQDYVLRVASHALGNLGVADAPQPAN